MVAIELQGLKRAQDRLRGSLPRQLQFGASRALNDVAYKVREAMVQGMRQAFDRPTPYILKSPWVGKTATRDSLEAWVYPRDVGGKSVDPSKVLRASVAGGQRRLKRFEIALQRAGILQPGLAAVPAPRIVTGREGDGYGGVRGPFIVRLLSYLQAFGEQGYRANMTERNRLRLSGRGRWEGRFIGAQTKRYAASRGAMAYRQGGVEYFVSKGRGQYTGRGSWKNGQRQHLAAGIWERSGLRGASVKPVFYFRAIPSYQARLPLKDIGDQVVVKHLPAAIQQRTDEAVRTAR
jgi:hypothetical protein